MASIKTSRLGVMLRLYLSVLYELSKWVISFANFAYSEGCSFARDFSSSCFTAIILANWFICGASSVAKDAKTVSDTESFRSTMAWVEFFLPVIKKKVVAIATRIAAAAAHFTHEPIIRPFRFFFAIP